MIAKQSVYLNLARDKALPDGDPDAKFLLVRVGQEVAEADLDRYEGAKDLADTEPEAKEVVPIPPPNLKDHGDTVTRQSIPQPKIKGNKEETSADSKKIAEAILPAKKTAEKKTRAKKPKK